MLPFLLAWLARVRALLYPRHHESLNHHPIAFAWTEAALLAAASAGIVFGRPDRQRRPLA